jgi:hypothetical protein
VSITTSAQAFVDGLTSPRLSHLAISVALAATILGALEYVLERGALWRVPVGWVLSTPYDDWSHAAWYAGRLGTRSDDTPLTVLIGGSAAREAVVSNDVMAQALARHTGAPMRFVNLGTRNQTLAEALVLTEQLPAVRRGVVLYSVHPMFLRDGPEDWAEAASGVRFPFRSPALGAILRDIAPDLELASRWHLVRLRPQLGNWLRQRVGRGAATEPLRYRDHLYEGRGPMSDAELLRLLGWVKQRLPSYAQHRDHNLRMLGEAVSLARSKGYRVGIVDLPRNPEADRLVLAPVLDDYREAIAALARREQVPYLDLHGAMDFERRDFYDHIHFLAPTRARFQPRFVNDIGRVLEGG